MAIVTTDPIDALVADEVATRWNAPEALGSSTWLTYSYSAGDQLSVPWDDTLATPSDQVRTVAEVALQQIESFTNLRFLEVDGTVNADIEVKIGGTSASGVAWLPYVTELDKVNSDILLNETSFASNQTMTAWHQWVIFHEIGHSLGLKHPHDQDLGNPYVLSPGLDTSLNTVMSYVNAGFNGFGQFDKTALRYLYGDGLDPAAIDVEWVPEIKALLHPGSPTSAAQHILTNSPDALWAGKGNDTVRGHGGDDLLYGNQGDDIVSGGAGDDRLYGGQNDVGWDEIWAGLGNDVAYGNFGSDLLDGYNGADTLFGGKNNDYVRGGEGDDVLYGNLGDDTLVGDAGADRFVFSGGGDDTVETGGFNAAEGDRLIIPGGYTGLSESSAGDLVIRHAAGQVTLLGVAPSAFSLDWLG